MYIHDFSIYATQTLVALITYVTQKAFQCFRARFYAFMLL